GTPRSKGRAPGDGREGRPRFALPAVGPNGLAVLAGFVAGLLYLPALQFGWVWDDALLAASRGASGPGAEGFHPFLSLLQRGEWALGAGNPAIFHVTNLLLHAAGAWLFFHLAVHLGATAGIAFAASLLFGANPLHVESVAFVSGRAAMTAAVFSLAALLAARLPRARAEGFKSPELWLALVLFAAAAFSDLSALVAPFLLIALDRWGAPRAGFAARRGAYAGFVAIGFAALLARILAPAVATPSLVDRGIPAAHAGAAIVHSLSDYLALLVWPHPLNAIRALSERAAAAMPWIPLLPIAALLAALVVWRRRDPLARVGALTLVLGLLPALPFEALGGPYVAERLAYLPSIGITLLVASLLAAIAAPPRGLRAVAVGLGIAAAGLAAYATLVRIPVWSDNVALLRASAEAAPTDPEPYLQLAGHHAAVGDAPAALAALDLAIARDSTIAAAHATRALVLGSLGRWPEAEAAARRATVLEPTNAVGWANLGDALTQQGKSDEAIAASRRAVELDGKEALYWYNYGVSLAATGQTAPAAEAYQKALAIDSTHVGAWNNLGAIYGGQGRLEDARHAYEKAVQLAPASLQARMNLALAYLRLGDKERAAEERAVIQRLDPAAARQLAEFFKDSDAKAAPAPARR
ncbi:MAG TPA: tetratricopeptide repeat protein, partial [Candidatus Eisenbacteria bacterium]|nr:tetratricopeptide repeat protein [Candidatus Eisenbacteria bacterium]